jgi:hypothetical protein
MAQKGAWAVKQMQLEAELAASGSVQGMQVCGSSHHCDMTMRTQTQDTSFCHRKCLMPTSARPRRQLKHACLDGFPLLLPWMLCKRHASLDGLQCCFLGCFASSQELKSVRHGSTARCEQRAGQRLVKVGELVFGCARPGHIGWYSLSMVHDPKGGV